MIIGVIGFISSGKNSIGDYLVTAHNFKSNSFASALKDVVAAAFDWPRHLMEGDTIESREFREQPDTWWSVELDRTITPRLMLQEWGTNIVRDSFDYNFWVKRLKKQLFNEQKDVVVTDVRFPNEIQMIKSLGGQIWRVAKGFDPHWYQTALMANQGDAMNIALINALGVHLSEYAWIGQSIDQLIANDGSLMDLYAKIDEALTIHSAE